MSGQLADTIPSMAGDDTHPSQPRGPSAEPMRSGMLIGRYVVLSTLGASAMSRRRRDARQRRYTRTLSSAGPYAPSVVLAKVMVVVADVAVNVYD